MLHLPMVVSICTLIKLSFSDGSEKIFDPGVPEYEKRPVRVGKVIENSLDLWNWF